MNQELKQLILDICKKYPVVEHRGTLIILGRQFRITLDKSSPTRPYLEIMVNLQHVYGRYFDINGNRPVDKDAMEIYQTMLAKLRDEQERSYAAAEAQNSINAVKQLRAALSQEQQKNR